MTAKIKENPLQGDVVVSYQDGKLRDTTSLNRRVYQSVMGLRGLMRSFWLGMAVNVILVYHYSLSWSYSVVAVCLFVLGAFMTKSSLSEITRTWHNRVSLTGCMTRDLEEDARGHLVELWLTGMMVGNYEHLGRAISRGLIIHTVILLGIGLSTTGLGIVTLNYFVPPAEGHVYPASDIVSVVLTVISWVLLAGAMYWTLKSNGSTFTPKDHLHQRSVIFYPRDTTITFRSPDGDTLGFSNKTGQWQVISRVVFNEGD